MKIYLAGPDVFRADPIAHFNSLKDICADYGHVGLSPLDNELTAKPGDSLSKSIYKANIRLIEECDVVIANLYPFRGTCIDDGTAFEIGYACAKGKVIYGYTPYNKESVVSVTNFLKGTAPDYPNIEDFGHPVNLMLYYAIKKHGEVFSTFKECVDDLQYIRL